MCLGLSYDEEEKRTSKEEEGEEEKEKEKAEGLGSLDLGFILLYGIQRQLSTILQHEKDLWLLNQFSSVQSLSRV